MGVTADICRYVRTREPHEEHLKLAPLFDTRYNAEATRRRRMTTAKKARATTVEKVMAMALEGMAKDIDDRALKLQPSEEAGKGRGDCS